MNRPELPDQRLPLLTAWLDQVLPDHGPVAPASSDASFRRYFRVLSHGRSWIVMDAPPEQEDCRPFIAVSDALARQGLRVPVVHERDLQQGFLLLDDLGSDTFLSRMAEVDHDQAYRRALDDLLRIQGTPAEELPPYDEALLLREMELFPEWYIARHCGRALSPEESAAWRNVTSRLCESALDQATVFVHRDYHSRNLMWSNEGGLGILDFQDAVRGPWSYDLISLLRDCYVAWSPEQVDRWLQYFVDRARQQGVAIPRDDAQWRRAVDFMGVQRHLKAIGIFARLNYRDGKANYLNDIPRTMAYVRQVCEAYPELHGLAELVATCPD